MGLMDLEDIFQLMKGYVLVLSSWEVFAQIQKKYVWISNLTDSVTASFRE